MRVLQLRTAQPGEVGAVVAVSVQTALGQRSPREIAVGSAAGVAQRVQEMYERALRPGQGGVLLVADDGGSIAGYLLLGIDVPPGRVLPEATVLDVWVAPAARGRTLAGTLHRAALYLTARGGVPVLKAMVALHNTASLAAHAKSGFKPEVLVCGKRL